MHAFKTKHTCTDDAAWQKKFKHNFFCLKYQTNATFFRHSTIESIYIEVPDRTAKNKTIKIALFKSTAMALMKRTKRTREEHLD